jgi:hypothetical protein
VIYCKRCKQNQPDIKCGGCKKNHCVACTHWHAIICLNPVAPRPKGVGDRERKRIKNGKTAKKQEFLKKATEAGKILEKVFPEGERAILASATPPLNEWEQFIWSKPMPALAKELGVSPLTLRKRCKILGLKTPPIGYWAGKKF